MNTFNYTEVLKNNRQDIIDFATDAVLYTDITVAQVMKFIMENEQMYLNLVEKERFPFSKMAQLAVEKLPLNLKVTDFTERVEAEMKARAKNSSSQFN